MATILTKELSRECYRLTDRSGRPIMVSLAPGDILVFRSKGKRTRYELPIAVAYGMAQIQFMEQRFKDRMARYNERKKLGLRAVRPKRPGKVFSPQWYEAFKKTA